MKKKQTKNKILKKKQGKVLALEIVNEYVETWKALKDYDENK